MNSEYTSEEPESSSPEPTSPQTFLERHRISLVLFAFISLIFIFFLYQGVGGIFSFFLFGVKLTSEHVGGFRISTLVGQLLLLLLPALLLTRLATRNPGSFLRLRMPRVREVIIPLVGIFSLQQMFQVYMVFQEKIPIPKSLQPKIEHLKQLIEETYKVLIGSSSIPELIFVILVIGLVPAVAEEILFRGLIQRSFEQGLGRARGLLLTALIFAIYHLNPFSFIPLIGLGLYLGFLVSRSNSIWVSVAAHFYNNCFACVAVYLGMNDNFVVTGSPEELSGISLLLTLLSFSLVFLISTYYFIFITRPLLPLAES